MRELKNYEQCIVVDFDELKSYLDKKSVIETSSHKRNLFVMTAASNFSGRKYDLKIIEQLKTGNSNLFQN
jgi:hypothetical protein